MKTFFISDLHFGHANIIKYESRPFESVEDMDNQMIQKWNAKVTKNDRVFILGDLSFHKDHKAIEKIVLKLDGNKILIEGNHDHVLLKELREQLQSTPYKRIKVEDKHFILFHYPIESWDYKHHGSIQLYGHVHSKAEIITLRENQYNVSAEVLDYEPCTIEKVIEKIKFGGTRMKCVYDETKLCVGNLDCCGECFISKE